MHVQLIILSVFCFFEGRIASLTAYLSAAVYFAEGLLVLLSFALLVPFECVMMMMMMKTLA